MTSAWCKNNCNLQF